MGLATFPSQCLDKLSALSRHGLDYRMLCRFESVQRFKGSWGQKSRQNFVLFNPGEIKGGTGEISE